jgi:group I intron endonuclease
MTNKTQKDRTYYLYRITNTVNDKIYIGQSVDTIRRWYEHKREAAQKTPTMAVTRAIKKYGNESFEFEVLAGCKSQDNANWLETELVKRYESHVSTDKGYNVTWGGMNAPKTDEWKAHMSKIMTGREAPWAIGNTYAIGNANWLGKPRSAETKQKISKALSGENHPNFGKTLPKETKKKMSMAASGENNPMYGRVYSEEERKQISERLIGREVSEETRAKISKSNKGRKLSDESRKKMSAAKKGKPSPHVGEKRTDEAKKKMSLAHLGKTWKLIDGVRVYSGKEKT